MTAAALRQPAPAPRTAAVLWRCACGGKGECAECRKKRTGLQRSASAPAAPALAPPLVHEVLRSPGKPLDDGTRAYMEPRFGHSFADVRVHADGRAAESAAAVHAHAYAVGRDLVFGAGMYSPSTPRGRRLIAHELAHVVQQGGAAGARAMPSLEIGAVNAPEEREAEHAANRVAEGATVGTVSRSPAAVRRYGHDAKSCTEADLKELVWPGDALARAWLGEAITALSASPLHAKVPRLLKCYFMDEAPKLDVIRANLAKLKARFDASDYFYVCDNGCAGTKENKTMGKAKVSLLGGGSGPIILCVNNLRTAIKAEWVTAHTILHEFCHRYLDFTGDTYCSNCCEGLSAGDALKNPDSYAGFVEDLHFGMLSAKPKPPQGQP